MGFADYAISVVKRNRALLTSFRKRNVFSKKHSNSQSALSPQPLDKSKLDEANHNRRTRFRRKVFIFLPLTILVGAVFYFLLDNFILSFFMQTKTSQVKYDAHPNLSDEFINDDDTLTYSHLIGIGDKHFNYGQIDQAYTSYLEAREVLPTDKAAYIGLTKSLLLLCKNKNLYCTQAEMYWVELKETDIVGEEELKRIAELNPRVTSSRSSTFKTKK